ncbi:hypothetical protein Tco_0200384 [Tanacetum coccineum]
MFESGSYKSHPEHVALYEALEASMERAQRDEFLAEKDKSQKIRRDDRDHPSPPLKDSDQRKKKRHDSDALGSSQPPATQSSAWKKSDTREALSSSSKQKSSPDSEQPVEDIPMPDTTHLSDSEDTNSAHLSKIKPRPEWLKPIPEEDRPSSLEPDWSIPTNDLPEPKNNWANALAKSYEDLEENKLLWKTVYMGSFISWFCKRIGKTKSSKSDLKVDLVNPEGHWLVPDVSKPLPLGGPPGQVTIQSQFFFNKDLEYLVSGDKGRRSILSISRPKAAQYLDFRLEELVLSLWIESECEYDIRAVYVRLNAADSQCNLSLDYERYGIPSYKEFTLLPASSSEWIESYQTKLNLITDWDASDFLFKEDYTIVSKPRVVIYRDINDQKKMMRETKVHKFSDGTLQRILDKLDHMVKDFKLYEYNPGMETRIWSENDRKRGKEFIEVIERRLKIRRIFRSLKSFVGGRLRDVDYRLIQRTKCFHPSDTQNIRVIPKYHNEDGNPARANIKQALSSFQDQERYEHVGPQDTRSQDGKRPQVDDQRLDLADDLKEAQDHISSTITSHKTKITTSKYKISHEESKTTS